MATRFEFLCPDPARKLDRNALRYAAVALAAGIPKALFLGRLIVSVERPTAAALSARAGGARRGSRRRRGGKKK
jgi:hypothetical protein